MGMGVEEKGRKLAGRPRSRPQTTHTHNLNTHLVARLPEDIKVRPRKVGGEGAGLFCWFICGAGER